VTFKMPVRELRQKLEELKISLEAVELFAHDAGYREASSNVYTARLRVSEALAALPKEGTEL